MKLIFKHIYWIIFRTEILTPTFDYINIELHNSFEKLNTVVVKGQVNAPGLYPLIEQSLKSIILRSEDFSFNRYDKRDN